MSSSLTARRLMTPEQFTTHIQTRFGLDLSKPWRGRTSALQRYLLPLGGLDHDTIYERDRDLKVQHLLAVQAIAWEAAVRIIEKNSAALPTPEPQPDLWKDQLQKFYIRIHSRPALDQEVQFLEQRFRQLLQQNVSPQQAWTAVVYTLLASVEFWYL
ncbi:hypothetical protein [Oligoflexus tunisiensis]|uniref:hypothetical protein n=1 Tax=Oligoflexus tunisiensis TaxID=708132 RepID=UPI00114CE4FC|nr:hypothetical protein [Oligoflexus tunisiensis]